jgi:outer membrane protein assembly factor BamB
MPLSDIWESHKVTKSILHTLIDTHVISRRVDTTEGTFFTSNNSAWIFDFRRVFLQPQYLELFARFFWDEMWHLYPFQIGWLEMWVIPLITAISLEWLKRGTPANWFIVRKERKETWLGNKIEWVVGDETIILLDDLFNSGNSFLRVYSSLHAIGKKAEHFFAFVHFGNPIGIERLIGHGVRIHYPFTISDFVLWAKPGNGEKYSMISPQSRLLYRLKDPNKFLIVPKSNPLLYKKLLIAAGEWWGIVTIEKDTGYVVWSMQVGHHDSHKSILSSPIIIGDTIVFGSYDGNLYCLDAATGVIIWNNVYADFIGSSPSFSKKHNIIYIGTEHSGTNNKWWLLAVDSLTGKSIWFQPFADFTHCSPGYSEKVDRVICGSNDYRVIICDAQTGKIFSDQKISGEVKWGFGFSEDGKTAYFGSWDEHMYAIDLLSGDILWRYKTDNIIYTTPLVTPEWIFFGSYDKYFYHLDAQWVCIKKIKTKGKIASQVSHITETIITFASNDWYIYFYDTVRSMIITTILHDERITTRILYNSPDIYMCDHMNQIFRIQDINSYLWIQ